MRALATICVLLLAALSLTSNQVEAFDSATDSEAEEPTVFQQEALGGSSNAGAPPGSTLNTIDEILPTQSQILASSTQDRVWALEEIYVADTSTPCGENPFPTYLPLWTDDYLETLEGNEYFISLYRDCERKKDKETYPWGTASGTVWLDFTFPAQISYEKPGKFLAEAACDFNWDFTESVRTELRLRMKGELWSYSPDCEVNKSDYKISTGGLSNEVYLSLKGECDYKDHWWIDEEATFMVDVSALFNGPAVGTDMWPGFYLWLTYRKCGDYGEFCLSTLRSGSGTGRVTSAPVGVSCGTDCNEAYISGTSVTLTAKPDPGSTFTGWSGNVDCPGIGPCTVIMNQHREVVAEFDWPTLSVSKISLTGHGNGRVTSSPGGIDCGKDCEESYRSGTSVTLTAKPDPGSTFTGWSGDVDCPGIGPCTVILNNDVEVVASFVKMPSITSIISSLLLGEKPDEKKEAGEKCGDGKIYDCDLQCVDDYARELALDTICHDGYMFPFVNLNCPAFDNDGGACVNQPGDTCAEGKVYDCYLKCRDKNYLESFKGNESCDDGTGEQAIALNCPAFGYDGGDCQPGDICYYTDLLTGINDCNMKCVDFFTLAKFVGDGICNDGSFEPFINLKCDAFWNDDDDCATP
jgi:hypothetical protein